MFETQSTSSRQSNKSRAQNFLDQIKRHTPREISQEFFATLALFKSNQIDTEETQKRVQVILEDYPHLLAQFEESIPTPTKPTPIISPALDFVNKVKQGFQDDPTVYDQFTSLLREYQRGVRSKREVKTAVEILLRKRPDLIEQFDQFYNQEGKMVRYDSNDTLPDFAQDDDTPIATPVPERQTLLRDLESGVARQSNWKQWIIFLSVILVIGGGFFGLYISGYLSAYWKFVVGSE